MKHQNGCCTPGASGDARRARSRKTVPAHGSRRRPELVTISAIEFQMGTDADDGYPTDGEGPRRRVSLGAYSIAPRAVTNAEFSAFVSETDYVTDAERCGWSFVFHRHVDEAATTWIKGVSSEARWWLAIEDACWQRPAGPGSDASAHGDLPVTHVSWHDAQAYCQWSGTRLPTEAEWECAARGGLDARRFPWGDELEPNGRHRCNIWQGRFPDEDLAEDGYSGPAPVHAYEPNCYGLFNVVGNVWEWCADWFSPRYHRVTPSSDPRYAIPTRRRSMRGGSFLCHRSYCYRYRVAARGSNSPDSTTSHCGFRVAG